MTLAMPPTIVEMAKPKYIVLAIQNQSASIGAQEDDPEPGDDEERLTDSAAHLRDVAVALVATCPPRQGRACPRRSPT